MPEKPVPGQAEQTWRGSPAEGLRGGARPVLLAIGAFLAVRSLVLLWLMVSSAQHGRSGYELTTQWDAQWYAHIAGAGYGFVRSQPDGRLLADYSFFPLFPFAERLVSSATGLRPVDAGALISAVAAPAAAAGVFAVGNHLFGSRTGVIATVLWAALPVGIVEWMAYSESLFTALAAWSLFAALTRRWLVAAVLACAAGLTRPVGAAVVAAVLVAALVEWLRPYRRGDATRRRSICDRRIVAAGIAPLGLAGYLVWVGWRMGSPTGYFEVAQGWRNGFDGGTAFAVWISGLLRGPRPVNGLLVAGAVMVLVGLVALCFRQRQPLPLLVFVTLLVGLAMTTSGYFGSKPRYLLPAFPLLFPPASWLAARRTSVSVVVLSALAGGGAIYGAVWLLGPGPP